MILDQRRLLIGKHLGAPEEEAGDAGKNLIGGLNEIHEAGASGSKRHAVIFCRFRLLGDAQAAIFLDGAKAGRTIRASPGQNDAGGIAVLVIGERYEKVVDRATQSAGLSEIRQLERSVGNRQTVSRRNDKNGVRLDTLSALTLFHGKCRMPADQLCQHAFMVRIEMLHDDEGEAGRDFSRAEHLAKSLQSSCR